MLIDRDRNRLATTASVNTPSRSARRRTLQFTATAAILTALALAGPSAQAQTPAPGSPAADAAETTATTEIVGGATVWPPGSDPLDVPYGEWAARHWTWLGTAPADQDPGSTDNCAVNQGGDVFFIPHTAPGNTHETTCVVQSGQAILASGGGTFCDRASGYGETEEELLACIEGDRPIFSNISVTIDGEAVPDIDRFWIVSPMHEVTFPEGNAFGMEPVTTDAIGAGWFVMITDLAPGEHTIVVHDDIDIPDDDEGPLPAELIAHVQVVDAVASPAASPS